MTGTAPDLDALLAHARWVETLSRQLCRDHEAAADAAQDTWLAALRTPPRDGRNPRGFLGTLLRNALRLRGRGEARRAQRERTAARPGFTEAAADAVARAELHRFLVQLVLDLPEPQRALVLLHYFEGLGIAAIARRSGFTAEAVRAHLRRARESLRRKLQHGSCGVRAGFALLLAQQRSLLSLGLLTMGIQAKIAIGAAAAAAVALLCWQIAAPPETAPAAAATASVPATAVAGAAPDATTADGERDATRRVAVEATLPDRVLPCRLVGLHRDAPWTAAVHVDLEGKDEAADAWQNDAQRVVPSSDGTFAIRLPAWTATCASFEAKFRADDALYLELDIREKAPSAAATRLFAAEVYALDVQVAGVLTGTVVDFRGAPVPAARVCALPWQNKSPSSDPRAQTNTAADGSFRIAAPMSTDLLVVAIPMQEASLSGQRLTGRHGAIADGNTLRKDLLAASVRVRSRFGKLVDAGTLTLQAAAEVTGVVLESGRPLPGVDVDWFPECYWEVDLEHLRIHGLADGHVVHVMPAQTADQRCTTDAEGRFVMPAPPGAPGFCLLTKQHWRFERLVEMRSVTPPAAVVFDLAPSLVVRVLRGEKPVERAWIALEPPTGESFLTDERGEVRLLRERAVAQKLKVMAPGEPTLEVEAPADASPERPLVIRLDIRLEGRPQVRFELEVEGDFRVRQIEGSLQPLDRKAGSLGFSRFRNDGEGPFAIAAPPGRYRLHLRAPQKAERRDTFVCKLQQEVVIGPGDTALNLRVRHGGRIAVDLRDQDGLFVRGKARLIAPDGAETAPAFWTDAGGVSSPGQVPGSAETLENLVPGRYELVLDLGVHGIHRRAVEVKACEVAAVRIVLP